jgi:NAD(P)-dependent dehydrogenase (short-subunit alcohol dehydrogenase family)
VIVAGRRKEALEQTIAGRDGMLAITLDMEDPEAITACAGQLLADHPSLNVLINNAGIMHREDLTRTRDLHNAEKTCSARSRPLRRYSCNKWASCAGRREMVTSTKPSKSSTLIERR